MGPHRPVTQLGAIHFRLCRNNPVLIYQDAIQSVFISSALFWWHVRSLYSFVRQFVPVLWSLLFELADWKSALDGCLWCWRAVMPACTTFPGRYWQAQNQGIHGIGQMGERGVKKGSDQQSSLKGWERVVLSQTNIGIFQRQCWGNFWEMGWSTYGLIWAHRYHLVLN